ncbi:hypothetical protein FRC06_003870, partial [Ceratobasidium sp. 370]
MPICPCCGDQTLSDQQIRWHLARRRRQLAAAFNIINQAEVGLAPHNDDLVPHGDDDLPAPDDDLAPRDDDPAPRNDGLAPGNVEPAPDNVGARRHGIDLAALIAREDGVGDGDADALADLNNADNMDLDDANELFVWLPDVPLGLGVLQNPLVAANNWDGEDELADITSPGSEIDEGSVGSNERDPEFNEGDWMRGLNPDAEPEMDEEELQDYLRQHLGDLPKEEWLDIFVNTTAVSILASAFSANTRISMLALFAIALDTMPLGGRANPNSIKQMRCRALHEELRVNEPDVIDDVFDGEIYCTLRNTKVHEDRNYWYFDLPDDIVLGFGTDGFSLYKHYWPKGSSAAWPLILVIYDLHPSICTKLENVICVGVVPGPKEFPLIEELLELADGVEASKVASEVDDFVGDGI